MLEWLLELNQVVNFLLGTLECNYYHNKVIKLVAGKIYGLEIYGTQKTKMEIQGIVVCFNK